VSRDWGCILFDLDGTLIDTEPSAAKAVEESFSSWGFNLDPTDAAQVAGRTWQVAFDFLFGKYPPQIPRGEAERLILEKYRSEIENHLIIIPGAVTAVLDLSKSYRIGLVSGSFRREILWALERLGVRDRFEVVLGAEDYPRSKPAPDGYLLGLEKLGVQAADCLIFEDSFAGIQSGKSAGAQVVAIRCSNHFGHDTSHADHHIQDLTGVSTIWVRSLRS
jgi:HAD superfamily hydrolase (TIGR01509 family)